MNFNKEPANTPDESNVDLVLSLKTNCESLCKVVSEVPDDFLLPAGKDDRALILCNLMEGPAKEVLEYIRLIRGTVEHNIQISEFSSD